MLLLVAVYPYTWFLNEAWVDWNSARVPDRLLFYLSVACSSSPSGALPNPVSEKKIVFSFPIGIGWSLLRVYSLRSTVVCPFQSNWQYELRDWYFPFPTNWNKNACTANFIIVLIWSIHGNLILVGISLQNMPIEFETSALFIRATKTKVAKIPSKQHNHLRYFVEIKGVFVFDTLDLNLAERKKNHSKSLPLIIIYGSLEAFIAGCFEYFFFAFFSVFELWAVHGVSAEIYRSTKVDSRKLNYSSLISFYLFSSSPSYSSHLVLNWLLSVFFLRFFLCPFVVRCK